VCDRTSVDAVLGNADALVPEGFSNIAACLCDDGQMVAAQFNDSITICGLSPFNTYFVLQALAAAGELDRGLAAVHQCWGVYVRLGASTTWEIAVPGWQQLLQPGDTLPGFTGYTSQAHPWSSGATAWASAHLAGVQALADMLAAQPAPPAPTELRHVNYLSMEFLMRRALVNNFINLQMHRYQASLFVGFFCDGWLDPRYTIRTL
jgi:hypothetical protein